MLGSSSRHPSKCTIGTRKIKEHATPSRCGYHLLHETSRLHTWAEMFTRLSLFKGIRSRLASRAMAQTDGRRSLTVEAQARSHSCPCDGQRGIGTGFAPGTSVFLCQYHSTNVLCAHFIRWRFTKRVTASLTITAATTTTTATNNSNTGKLQT